LNKKIVLITGASKGIGKALTEKMLKENYFVIGTSRKNQVDLKHKNFYSVKLDLSKPHSIEQAHKKIMGEFKHIDLLINNAGIGPDLNAVLPESKTFDQTFGVNVKGTVFFTEPLIEKLSQRGIILNISSKMGSVEVCNLTDSVAYRMSKSALNMYTQILANRLKHKVRVAAIHPGWVKTSIAESNLIHARLSPEESAQKIIEFLNTPFKKGIFWKAESQNELAW
jgi:NAD(P)-dependent dehydrogenase (short-subunit alcohol dehydrogenase family)